MYVEHHVTLNNKKVENFDEFDLYSAQVWSSSGKEVMYKIYDAASFVGSIS